MTGAGLATLAAAAAVVFTALLFARAVVHKLSDFVAFTGYVADYGVVPERWTRVAAVLVVATEALVVAMLLVPGAWTWGAMLAALVLLGYAAAIARVVRDGRPWVECGCGGAVQPVGWPLVVRNGALAAIASGGAAATPAALSLGESIAVLAAGFAIFTGYLLVEQILGNAAHMSSARQNAPKVSP